MGETWWSKDQAGQVNGNKETDMAENQGLKTIRSEEAVTTLLSTARQHRTPRKKRMTRSSKLWQKLEQAYVVEFASCNRELHAMKSWATMRQQKKSDVRSTIWRQWNLQFEE